jgi:S1-C subfamily serine protease
VFIDAGSAEGSGIRISPDEILTAQHVVANQTGVNVSVKGEGLVFARVVGYDTQRDVALLTFSNKGDSPVADLPKDSVVRNSGGFRALNGLGNKVMVIGYASSVSNTTPMATFGRIGVSWNVVPGDIRQGQIDAAVTNGMSGGGVFSTHGELLGMLLTRSPNFAGNVRYLQFEEINEVINDLRNGLQN